MIYFQLEDHINTYIKEYQSVINIQKNSLKRNIRKRNRKNLYLVE